MISQLSKRPATKDLSYQFKLTSGEELEFEVKLQRPEMALAASAVEPPPPWTKLENAQCNHCPLHPGTTPHCPIAVNLVGVIEVFKDRLSHDTAEVTIRTDDREYHRSVPLQTGLSSLMGLIMVTSGCPIMDKLRPMVLTHLPFANVEETLYRALSSYLMAQYVRQRQGATPDWELTEFGSLYQDIVTLNHCFSERLRSIRLRDATLNALIQLDCFAVQGSLNLERTTRETIEPLFQAYLD